MSAEFHFQIRREASLAVSPAKRKRLSWAEYVRSSQTRGGGSGVTEMEGQVKNADVPYPPRCTRPQGCTILLRLPRERASAPVATKLTGEVLASGEVCPGSQSMLGLISSALQLMCERDLHCHVPGIHCFLKQTDV